MSSRQSKSFPVASQCNDSFSTVALGLVLVLVLALASGNAIVNENDTINKVLKVKKYDD